MTKVKTMHKGRWWKILLIIAAALLLAYLVITLINVISCNSKMDYAKAVEKVEYTQHVQIAPTIDTDGYYTFTTDGDFKILQLSDLHIGGGAFSIGKDDAALSAVEEMIRQSQPDLVIVTGDITFPVPYSAGTNNNKRSTELFIELMNNLQVYWTVTFGNHDQEIYSTLNGDQVAELYENAAHPESNGYCLFQRGKADVDGNGNTMIKVKNTSGITTQVLVLLDSHSYTDQDPLGIKMLYGNISDNQLDYYETEINRITAANKAIDSTCATVKSLGFWHIPIAEYLTAYNAYVDSGYAASGANFTYHYGKAWEGGRIVYSGEAEDDVFERMYALGSTQGIFCGHDHDNNYSITYDPNATDELDGIRLSYTYSVDYLAYAGISSRGYQRGCTEITVKTDGTFDCALKNLYADFGVSDSGEKNLTPPQD